MSSKNLYFDKNQIKNAYFSLYINNLNPDFQNFNFFLQSYNPFNVIVENNDDLGDLRLRLKIQMVSNIIAMFHCKKGTRAHPAGDGSLKKKVQRVLSFQA